MNEISVVVQQEPGKVSWNFEEIKKALEEELEVYRTTAYTDVTIKKAKEDAAKLRKLSEAIEDRRKEVKEKCLEPYTAIEAQAKELVALIEKPIQAIKTQVDDYEKRRKEAAKKEILNYWNTKVDALPEDIREKARAAIYDTRWENATATKKSWKEGIENGIQNILDEIATIKSFASEFEEDMLTVYKVDLSLQKAIAKMNELKAQQERILEIERKKREAEKKRQEEEARKREQEALRQKQAGTLAVMMPEESAPPAPFPQKPPQMELRASGVCTGFRGGKIPPQEEQPKMGQQEPQAQTKAYPGGKAVKLLITGTPEQITKIENYIRFTGATYQEV